MASGKGTLMDAKLLFSRANAAKAATSLKTQEWTQPKILDLVLQLRKHGKFDDLAEPGVRLLSSLVSNISNPLVRTLCLDTGLRRILDEKSQITLWKGSNDNELAVYEFLRQHGTVKLDKELLSRIEIGLESGHLPDSIRDLNAQQWCYLFNSALNGSDFSLAKTLWQHKSHLKNVPLTAPMLSRFVEVVGAHKDRRLLSEIKNIGSINADISSGTVAACLRCFSNWRELLHSLKINNCWLDQVLILQDARSVSDLLANHLIEVLAVLDGECSTLVGNLLLQGAYRQNTSQTVFHLYRILADEYNFKPDEASARVLANAAFRLGNSKNLMYNIWDELRPTSRGFYETWIMCQLIGNDYTSVLFVLAEMARNGIPLRQHLQRTLFRKFDRSGNTVPLLEITNPSFTKMYTEFDKSKALKESPDTQQAQSNADCFKFGFRHTEPDKHKVLEEMLHFDKRRK